jgi:lysophospholipase L1-like esterase
MRKALVGIGFAAGVLLLAELGARLALGRPSLAREVPYAPDERVGFRLAAGFRGDGATTNSLGTRGREIDPEAPVRVLVLGDSMTLGWEVRDEETFCAQLERRLGAGAQVVNAGCPGYGPAEELAALERLGPAVKPTAVVTVFFTGNDFLDAGQLHPYEVIGGKLVPSARYHGAGALGRLGLRLQGWVHSLGLTRLIRELGGSGFAPGDGARSLGMDSPQIHAIVELDDYGRTSLPGAEAVTKGWHRLPAYFRRIDELARSLGARLSVAVLPLPLVYDAGLRAGTGRRWGVDPGSIDAARPSRAIVRLLQPMGIATWDLTSAFAGSSHGAALHGPGDLHLSPLGHRLVAEELAPRLR